MTKFNKITEIIPDDIPQWASEAIQDGNFFKVAIALVEATRWVSVKDRLPAYKVRAGSDSFVQVIGCANGMVGEAMYCNGVWTMYGVDLTKKTMEYWMPMPEPPIELPDSLKDPQKTLILGQAILKKWEGND